MTRKKKLAFVDTLPFEQVEILSGGTVQITLRRAAAMAGKTLPHRIQVTTFDAPCRNVAAGLGIAIVPRESADAYVQTLNLRLIPLTDAWAERRFVICMRSREALSAAGGLLVDFFCMSEREPMPSAWDDGTVRG